jgi:hypothetical protein
MTARHAERRRMVWLLFLFFQALYGLTSSGNAFRVPDEFEVYYQAEHLIDAGDISVPQAVQSGLFFGRFGLDGKPYAPYGPLAAILVLPHHLFARAIARIAGVPRGTLTWTFLVSGLTMLSTATAAALAVAGFYRAALLLEAAPSTAFLLSMMLGAASVLWPYGTCLYSEAWQAAAFIWAAVLLLERRVAPAALLLLGAGLIKVTSIVFIPGFIAAVLFDRSAPSAARLRTALALGAAIAVAVAIHLAWNVHRFGNLFDFGYNWAETVPVLPAHAFALTEAPRGLAVLLLSPGKSLLIWVPVSWLAIMRLRECPRPVLAGVLTSLGLGLIFFGAYLFPEGGYAHGPRHFVPIVPLLALPAAAPGRPWRRQTLLACFAVGVTLAVLSVSISFLQDQALGAHFGRLGYYDRIDPAPGRAWNRYRLEYVPFVRTITSGNWPVSRAPGAGIDFFWLHLARVRSAIPEGRVIPGWLPWTMPMIWMLVLTVAGFGLMTNNGSPE